MEYKCKHCQDIRINSNSLRNHERLCALNPFRQEHPRGNLGKTGWNKGLSKNTDERIKLAALKCSETTKGRRGKKLSLITKEKLSEIRSNALNNNAFYSKRVKYNGVTLDSTYELILAKDLDLNNIKWIRPKSLIWIDNGQKRRYIPDFYLPEFNVFLDPKNDFLIKKDEIKIKSAEKHNNVKIIVLNKNQLSWKSIVEIMGDSAGHGKVL